jgi:hypothetical protein
MVLKLAIRRPSRQPSARPSAVWDMYGLGSELDSKCEISNTVPTATSTP